MDNIYILKEIARWDKSVWRLFSLLNWEMNKYFNVKGYEYEIAFRMIGVDKIRIYYKLDGNYHRSDGPAMIYNNGGERWYFNGKYHRLDGPAIIRKYRSNWWYNNGKLHRLDGPAIEYYKEDMKNYNSWWVDGKEIGIDDEKE